MKTWFSIRAQADASGHDAIVAIRDYIGEATGAANEFVAALEKSGSKKPLVVINSRGGDVLDSLAIYSAIASLDATVRIAGLALSAASYIAAAAKRVEIVANGWLMLHAPRALTGGTAAELTETAAQLSKFEADYRAAYMRKSGKDETTVAAWLSRDTWMNAEEAKAAGLVDVIRPPMAFAASADVGKMASAPDAVRKLSAAAPNELSVGDYVVLPYGDGETKGEVVEVITSGTATGADGSVDATPEDPAALVDVLREVDGTGQFEETDVQVARLFSALTKTDEPAIVETESPEAKASDNQTKTMSKTAKLLALLGVQPAAEDSFLASAIADLGVTPEAVTEARKTGTTDFLATHIADRIAAADGAAKAATDRANAILAKLGVDTTEADPATKVADVIEAKASAKAAEILAKRGFPSGKIEARTNNQSSAKPLAGLALAQAAHRARVSNNN